MSPDERKACLAALDGIEREVSALRERIEDAKPDESDADLLRIKAAAAEYGVSSKTARRWAKKSGERHGGVLFVRRSRVGR